MKINRKALFSSLALAALVYIALSAWSNVHTLSAALLQLRWKYVPWIFALSLANYSIRFLNWQFYLSRLGITNLKRSSSLLIYFSGFALTITPGKVGELIRSYLLKEQYQIPIRKTGSLVLVDRLTDLIALVLIAALGGLHFHYGLPILLVLTALIFIVLIFISHRPLAMASLAQLGRLPGIASRTEQIKALYETSYTLLRPQRLLVILILSFLAWSCECLGFYLTFQALDISASLLSAFFIYAFSTVIGAVALLPGGLGLTEGSLAGLLVLAQVGKAPAAAATLVIRVATLWFGIVVGAISLVLVERKGKQ